MTKIATIARNPIDSPNMTTNDAAILQCITDELEANGADALQVTEGEELPCDIQAVCSMSRTKEVLEKLKKAEKDGIIVFNATKAVENCSRRLFMEILHGTGIQQPPYRIIESSDTPDESLCPCWIKKADGWSTCKEDVCFAATAADARITLEQMASRGIMQCIQMQHCPGDIVKFYGIGEDFFRHCYPCSGKFGHEKIHGTPKHNPFDSSALKEIAQRAASAVGLTIYGGDAVVTADGSIFIIDINDFPSFTAVRDEAAKEIARLIISNINRRR